MTLNSRAKGARAMKAVVQWLQANGHPYCALRAPGEAGDDIVGVPGLSIEIKDHAKMDLAGWLDQCAEQKGTRPGIVIHKRKGKSDVGEWYCTATVKDMFEMVK